MMQHSKFDDEDEEMNMGAAPMLGNKKTSSQPVAAPDIPLCGFASVQFYAPYFDVETEDIRNRILACIAGFRDDSFLAYIWDKPDLYGPFWIATTLVFCIAVVSHFSSYVYSILNSKATWSYDFQSILNVASVVYSFVALVPAGLWFIMKQYVTTDVREINLVTAMCVYGYSLLFFIPAVLVMLIPSEFLAWVALLAATTVSALFSVKNFGPTIMASVPAQYVPFLLGGLAFSQFVFMLMIKFSFF